MLKNAYSSKSQDFFTNTSTAVVDISFYLNGFTQANELSRYPAPNVPTTTSKVFPMWLLLRGVPRRDIAGHGFHGSRYLYGISPGAATD